MIYEKDLDESIARYQGETNPSINTCIKLAACYALKHELFGEPEQFPAIIGQSYSTANESTETPEINYDSGTEFSEAIKGQEQADVWPIMDELMSTLQAIMPRLYDGVMRRLRK